MSHRNARIDGEDGFTIVELTVVMVMAVILMVMFYTFFHTTFSQYLNTQKDSTSMTTLTAQANRVSNVVRGLTGIVSGSNNDMVLYSYFYPSDSYVSLLHYYLSNGQLLADVTRMTSNPPIGTPIAGSTKTFVIISNYFQPTGTSLFTYYDAGGTAIATPLTDVNQPKSIQVSLAVSLAAGGSQSLNVQVGLRNRKVNL